MIFFDFKVKKKKEKKPEREKDITKIRHNNFIGPK